MSFNKRSDDWLELCLIAARDFIRGDISEEEYIDEYILENAWPENPLLRMRRVDFNQMIKKMKVKTRRLYFFHSSGLTYRKVVEMFGYGHNRVQKYLSLDQKRIDPKFISQLAVVHRIPPEWLVHEIVEDMWETYHFHSIGVAPQSIGELLSVLASVKEDDEWVQGYILRTKSRGLIYLRLEAQRGNILIEVSNSSVNPIDVIWLLSNLKNYNLELGKVGTVIPSHDNLAIVCKNNNTAYCLPVGFNSLNISTQLGKLEI